MYTQIAAFWRNDCDDGLGFRFADNLNEFANEIENQVNGLIAENADPDKILGELTWAGKRRNDLTQTEELLCVFYIAYLEKIGRLKSDNYNGMLYMREVQKSGVVDGQHRMGNTTRH